MSYFSQNYRHLSLPLATENSTGFRPAQLAAVHAIGAHFFSSSQPGIIVMPTGSGKSAVITTAPFLLNAKRVLVLTPSRLVREQLAENFQSLVDLRKLTAIPSQIQSPSVRAISSFVGTADQWEELRTFDVVVATVPSVSPRPEAVANPPTDLFDLVLVDEAHHSPARSWAALLQELSSCRQVLFTATPFRRDQKEIPGRVIFRYDLKRARDDQVFGEINYEAVVKGKDQSADFAIAQAVAARYSADREAGFRHLVMVRADTVSRAKELLSVYESCTSLKLELVKGTHTLGHVKRVIRNLEEDKADGVVCVNMFGEGFNLPRLKIAGIHSPHKSLAVTLQFIGRFSRRAQDVGPATFLAEPHESSQELGELYESGSSWRELVANLSDSRIDEEIANRDMLNSFQVDFSPDFTDFSLYSVRPYSHLKVYSIAGNIDINVMPGFPTSLDVVFKGVSDPHGAAVYITRQTGIPRWCEDERLVDVEYDAFIFHFNQARRLLFVCSSIRRESLYDRLVLPMTGGSHAPLSSSAINRVLRNLQGIRVFSLGMKTRNPLGRTESYQQRSGSQVDRSVQEVDSRRFDRGHIFATALDGEQSITIGLSTASKIWQNEYLRIPQLINICDALAEKIANRDPFLTRTGLDLLSPGEELEGVPDGVVFAIWASGTYSGAPIATSFDSEGVEIACSILELNIAVIDSRNGHCDFSISGENLYWEGRFQIGNGPLISKLDPDAPPILVNVMDQQVLIEEYLSELPPSFYREDLSRVEGTSLYPHRGGEAPFDISRVEVVDWNAAGVDIRSEKDDTRNGRSIFSWVEDHVRSMGDTFLFCDDGAGEVADFIRSGLKIVARG